MKFSNEEIDNKLLGRNLKRLDDYINIRTPINWECLICHYVWSVTPDNILSKEKGCPRCSLRVLSNKEVDQRLVGSHIKRLGNYIGSCIKIEWQCLLCNHIWSTEPRSVINLDHGCPICNTPGNNEKMMLLFLDKNGLVYESQFSLRKLDSNLPAYRIDVYFPVRKIAIEYNGKQHYEATRFGSKYTEKDFVKQIERDEYVRQICKQYGIELFEIDGRKYRGEKLRKFLTDNILSKMGALGFDGA